MRYLKNFLLILLIFSITIPVVSAAEIIAAPNPWLALRDASTGGIGFFNLPASGELRVYTVTGDLVRKISFSSTSLIPWAGINGVMWDGKNDNGEEAASGVYVWLLKSESLNKSGKVIIIR
jgi:hypothetical protein